MEAAGIERASFQVASPMHAKGYESGACGLAATVLGDVGTDCRCMTSDDRLRRILEALQHQPEEVLKKVEALCLQPASRNILAN